MVAVSGACGWMMRGRQMSSLDCGGGFWDEAVRCICLRLCLDV